MQEIYLMVNNIKISGLLNEITGETIIFENQHSFWHMTSSWKTRRATLNSLDYYANNNLIEYEENNDNYRVKLLQKITFPNPTTASNVLACTSKNGWDRWRLKSNDLLIRTVKLPNINAKRRKKEPMKPPKVKQPVIILSDSNKIKQKNEFPYLKAFRLSEGQKAKTERWEQQGYNLSSIIRHLIDNAPESF